MINQLIYLLSVLFLISCRNGSPVDIVTFKEPQPIGKKNLERFPKQLQANYQSEDKSYILTVTDKFIIRTYDNEIRIPKDSLASDSLALKGDTLYDKSSNQKYKVTLLKDTVVIKFDDNNTDTIFKILADRAVLKYFKGCYFLNTLNDNNSWSVRQLCLTKGILTIGYITDSIAINQLKAMTHSQSDTVNFNLTKKQFKTFVKSESFTYDQKFIRVRKN